MDTNAAEFRRVALQMKEADAALLRLARKNIRAVVAPVVEAVRAEARATLPKTGGLNERVAATKTTVSVLTGVNTAGVRLRMRRANGDLRSIDAGTVRHPLYGNRDHWYENQVEPGFFSRPVNAARPAVTEACMAALRESAKIAGYR